MIGSRTVARIAMPGLLALAPGTLAHEGADGLHQLADGVISLSGALPYLLLLLTLGLLAGRQRLPVHYALALLAISIPVGAYGAWAPGDSIPAAFFTRGFVLLLGLLVLADVRLHNAIAGALCLVSGVLFGVGLKTTAGVVSITLMTVIGSAVPVLLLFLIAAAVARVLRVGWGLIAIRVLGSWVCAIAAIDIAFMIEQLG